MTRTNAEENNDPTPAGSTNRGATPGSRSGKAPSKAKATASAAKKAAPKKAAPKKATADKATAKPSTAKPSTAKKSAGKATAKAAPKKTTAKKATSGTSTTAKARNASTRATAPTPAPAAASSDHAPVQASAPSPTRVDYPTNFRDDGQQNDIGYAVALKKFELGSPTRQLKSSPHAGGAESGVALVDSPDDDTTLVDDDELNCAARTAAEALMALDPEPDSGAAEASDATTQSTATESAPAPSGLEALVDIANGKSFDSASAESSIQQLDIATSAAAALSQLLDEESDMLETESRFVEDIDVTPPAPTASAPLEAPITFCDSDANRGSKTLGRVVGVLLIVMGLGMLLSRVF